MAKDLKNKSVQQLKKNLIQKRKALHEFQFSIAGSKTRDVKEGRNLRKDIARILTELNSRRGAKSKQA